MNRQLTLKKLMDRQLKLKKWYLEDCNYYGVVMAHGVVYGHHRIEDGIFIHTSGVAKLSGNGGKLSLYTCSGSHYQLLLSEADLSRRWESFDCAVKNFPLEEETRQMWINSLPGKEETLKPLKEREETFLAHLQEWLDGNMHFPRKDEESTGSETWWDSLMSAADEWSRKQCLEDWCWVKADFWERILPLFQRDRETMRILLPKFMEEWHMAGTDWELWINVLEKDFFKLCKGNRKLYRLWYETLFLDWMDMCCKRNNIKNKERYGQIIGSKRPRWYTDENFLRLVLEKSKMEDSCIYLLWMHRAMERKLRLCRQEKYGGIYLRELMTGQWREKERDDCVEVELAMAMESVEIVEGEGPLNEGENGFPEEDRRVLDQNDLEFFILCRKNGLLRRKYVDQYMEYAFEKNLLAVIPGLLDFRFENKSPAA